MRKKIDNEKTLARFLSKVQFTNTCWLWTSNKRGGYGLFKIGTRQASAHRWFYEQIVAPIALGLTIDHLCRVRNCVNPDHLEPVSNKENSLRGVGACAQNARKTHCKRGHEFTSENTYIRNNQRTCRTCRTIRGTEWMRQFRKRFHVEHA